MMSKTPSGKESFIEQTKAARQERERERRLLESSLRLQSAARGFLTRTRLRKSLHEEVDAFLDEEGFPKEDLKNTSTSTGRLPIPEKLFRLLRRFMFAFEAARDRERFERLSRLLLSNMIFSIDQSADQGALEDSCYATVAFRPKLTLAWIHQVKRILAANSNYLKLYCEKKKDILANSEESKSLSLHLNMLVTFTAPRNWPLMKLDKYAPLQPVAAQLGNNIISHLVLHGLYPNLRALLLKMMVRSRPIISPAQLAAATTLSIRPLLADKCPHNSIGLFLLHIMSLPTLIVSLESLSPESHKSIISNSILRHSLEHLKLEANCQTIFNALEANYALCLMANLIHLAHQDPDTLKELRPVFIDVVTRLLNCCQQYVVSKQSSLTHWHPVLGWFSQKIDSNLYDTMTVVKGQLRYLWSPKMILILFSSLHDAVGALPEPTTDVKALEGSSKPSDAVRSTSDTPSRSHLSGPSSSRQVSALFQRAVDKMNKLNIPRTFTGPTNALLSSSASTSGGGGGGVSSASIKKLDGPEASEIARVCNLYTVSVNTLSQVKLDILTLLSFQELVPRNLWRFIRSLSSLNGLKAFLDYLALHSKCDLPQFQILILFTECASHLVAILDDFELYNQQKPFTLDELSEISAFLNLFVFRLLWNDLIDIKSINSNVLFNSTHNLLELLYRRDSRRSFCPLDHWLIKEIKVSHFMRDLDGGKRACQVILQKIPHIIPHKDRVILFRKWVANEKSLLESNDAVQPLHSTLITIHRSRIVEDGYQQLALLPGTNLKGVIRVRFINELGVDEAGIDQHGVFKEFLEETIKRVFDPSLNLFRVSTENRLYPSPTSCLHENHLLLFEFVGKILAKAIYEGIVVDVPFAPFFLSQVLGQATHSSLYSSIDELPSLDPDLYKNLTYIKHYEGDVDELGLTFSIDEDFLGQIVNFELIPGGKAIPVTRDNRISYIHHIAHFKMVRQIHEQTAAFIKGFRSLINSNWLSIFSTPEFQRLISGDCIPLDLLDLRKHTQYFGGFHNSHRVIKWLWDILESDMSREEHERFLKFITSCSKPPVLGFAHLQPPFSIRCVEVSDDQDTGDTVGSVLRGFFTISGRRDPVNRLPTSSTCFNLLKLPNYQKKATLREKLKYAINSSTGFELS